MRWLKRTISILLLLAAVGIVLATAFSDHSDDYGRVSVPGTGTVHLPKGAATVYYRLRSDSSEVASGGDLAFAVTPAQGGSPLAMTQATGEETSDVTVTRSETIGEIGSVAKLDLPEAGDYRVTGNTNFAPGTSYLEFGTNAGNALLQRWKLIAALVLGALVLAFIPLPRSGRRRDRAGEPHWSSDPRAPYAG
jgi:hypothetical protein